MIPRRYEIATLSDFTKVPPRRLRACLKEFATLVELTREVAAEVRGAAVLDRFEWIDDGKTDIDLRLEAKEAP